MTTTRPTSNRLARAAAFDVTPDMIIDSVTVDGQPAEFLQRESLRLNLTRGGNNLFLVEPPEPLRSSREYEFEFRHHGKVILDAGDRVFYVRARGNWYPMHGAQFVRMPSLVDTTLPRIPTIVSDDGSGNDDDTPDK